MSAELSDGITLKYFNPDFYLDLHQIVLTHRLHPLKYTWLKKKKDSRRNQQKSFLLSVWKIVDPSLYIDQVKS